ncbi:MAG: metallo-mystery pair system four-Cys motif protein [Chloroflexi bacterium]|nr:metallo-mystery pair system four-Cys motif protein [Chloroflexota bacterium]
MSRFRLPTVLRASLTLALAALTALPLAVPAASAQETVPVTIAFKAMVGELPFACGQKYAVGTTGATVLPSDFRFYVSEVMLLDASGNATPLELEQDGKWQYKNVALLDFEDKSGPCTNGTSETRDVVVGSVPKGSYSGVRFSLGVPTELNHQDSTIAPSPLNLTTLFWTWQAGYKFFRVDLEPDRMAMGPMGGPMAGAPKPEAGQTAAGAGATGPGAAGHGAATEASAGWAIHLGSTGCMGASQQQAPDGCSNPNRPSVELTPFEVGKNAVVVDLAALLASTNVEVNQPESAFGCMSAPNDGDCAGIMAALGLPFGDAPAPTQTTFRTQ